MSSPTTFEIVGEEQVYIGSLEADSNASVASFQRQVQAFAAAKYGTQPEEVTAQL
jgi:hypothetical protein